MRQWWLCFAIAPAALGAILACDTFESAPGADAGRDGAPLADASAADAGSVDADAGVAAPKTQLAVGADHSCALLDSGDLYCWGRFDKLGVEARALPALDYRPERVSFAGADGGPSPKMARIAAGREHTCAVSRDGELYCWGANDGFQLTGDLARPTQALPKRIAPPTGFERWAAVAAGPTHTCAVAKASGAAEDRPFCWGGNTSQEVNSTLAASVLAIPTEERGATGKVVGVAVGVKFSCAFNAAGRAFCWGVPTDGRLGDGNVSGAPRAAQVLNPDGQPLAGVSRLWAGGATACAETPAGVYCWGLLAKSLPRPAASNLPALLTSEPVSLMAFSVENNQGAYVVPTKGAFAGGTGYTIAAPLDLTTPSAALAGQRPYAWAMGPSHMCVALRTTPTETGTFKCLGQNLTQQLGTSASVPQSTTLLDVFDLKDAPPGP
jgi:hypothetical protein